MNSLFIGNDCIADNVRLIVFDKDGTLIDIHHYWSSMIRIRASIILSRWSNVKHGGVLEERLINIMGVDSSLNKLKPEGPVGIMSREYIVDIVREYVCQNIKNVTNDDVESVFKEVDMMTANNMMPLLKLLPNVEKLLSEINSAGVKAVIASTDLSGRSLAAMKALGLDGFFTEIIGGDCVERVKPAPDMLKMLLTRTSCEPCEAVVIGDHPVDIIMGESVNTRLNIGVLTGLSNLDAFSGLKCAVVNDLSEVQVK